MRNILSFPLYFIKDLFSFLSRKGRPTVILLLLASLSLTHCGGGAIGGGIGLDAPVADLEGGTSREAAICGTFGSAPAGSFVRVSNISDPNIPDVEANLAADDTYSVKVCMTVGQSVNVQVFNSNGEAISAISSINRQVDDRTDLCPDPSNAPPTCP